MNFVGLVRNREKISFGLFFYYCSSGLSLLCCQINNIFLKCNISCVPTRLEKEKKEAIKRREENAVLRDRLDAELNREKLSQMFQVYRHFTLNRCNWATKFLQCLQISVIVLLWCCKMPNQA